MNNRQITSKQMQAIIMMFLMGSSYVMGDVSKTKQDTWITFVLGAVMEIPLIFVYCAIIQKYPDKNLFEIVEILFGKIIGKIICGLYAWYAIHLSAMVMRTFAEFIHILNMPETPIVAIISFMILLTVWGVRSGPENMGRIARVTFPILSSFVIITFLIGMKDMNFQVLQPMLSVDTKAILTGSYTSFAVPFSELIVCLPLFSSLKPQGKPKNIYLKGLGIALVVLLIAHFRNILILGIPSSQMFYYSSYHAVSIVSVGEFFTRIEVLIGISVILAGFMKTCVLLFTASAGLAKICNQKDSKTFAVPCGLIVVVLAVSQYQNAPDIFKWIDYLRFYNMPFHVILPVLIWIVAIIKSKVKKQDAQPKPEKPEMPDNSENIGSLD